MPAPRVALAVALIVLGACSKAPKPEPSAIAAPAAPAPSASAIALDADPLKPAAVTFASGTRTLHGFLYRPSGAGPFPAIVFNHGSEPEPGEKRGQAAFYVPHGYALFVPHRRGQGRSREAGEDINTKANQAPAFVAELVAQTDDVMAALQFLAAQPFVDAARVAVAGCSLGGIESLLAAERGTGIVAAIDFAGGAITWAKTPLLQERMKVAARGAKVPVFFVQAENDFDTTPSRVLGDEMKAAGKSARVRIFPPNGKTAADGHAFCMGGAHPPWGEDVLAFLRETLR